MLSLKQFADLVADGRGVTEISKAAGMSRHHFSRSWSERFGSPPSACIRKVKALRALRLILTTNQRLADIAAECGFASHAHMTEVITRQIGACPARIREALPPADQPP